MALTANVPLPEEEEIFVEDAEDDHVKHDGRPPAGLEVCQQLAKKYVAPLICSSAAEFKLGGEILAFCATNCSRITFLFLTELFAYQVR